VELAMVKVEAGKGETGAAHTGIDMAVGIVILLKAKKVGGTGTGQTRPDMAAVIVDEGSDLPLKCGS
jgi:hypothetical protein